MKIFCVGDSITWGAWDLEGGWVARVRRRIDALCIASQLEKFVLTYNLGISSDTSERALKRMPGMVKAFSYEEHESAFVISLGTNDSVWLKDNERYWVPIDEFVSNMTQLVALANEVSDKVLLLGSAGVDETKTRPYRSQANIESSNDDIARYDAATAEVAKSAGVKFVPVFEQFMDNEPTKMLFDDGVHPNDQSHQFIADLVWPHIQAWL